MPGWDEVDLDLFETPLSGRPNAVCGNVHSLPFQANCFGAIVCVGEVLGYCDPATVLREFRRVLVPGGLLIADFGNSRGVGRLFSGAYGRPADLISDDYNGSPEATWVYDHRYIKRLLGEIGFEIRAQLGTHTWSALARLFGASPQSALRLEGQLDWAPFPSSWADLTTIAAELRRTAE